MMRILLISNENKYYDDNATCSREQAFIIGKWELIDYAVAVIKKSSYMLVAKQNGRRWA